jgi:hypothetical protein
MSNPPLVRSMCRSHDRKVVNADESTVAFTNVELVNERVASLFRRRD